MQIWNLAKEYLPETIKIRRDIHRHPELSGQEERTEKLVCGRLDELGISYRRVPGHGVIGTIAGASPGKTIALRADMDALPIQEETGAEYASEIPGVMHACGHDCHTASLLSAAKILSAVRDSFPGTARLLFQPSEEGPPGGAVDMIKYGCMDSVDAVFGIHMNNNLNAGQVSVEPGPRMAASLRGYFDITGKGGHGGEPHDCIDAIVAASACVMNLQTIASRELYMRDSAVITVGVFSGGKSFNSVSEKVHMEATIKFFNPELEEKLRESITRIVTQTADVFRAKAEVTINGFCRPVINDPALSKLAEASARKIFGDQNVRTVRPMSGSEDFSRYLAHAPGVFAFIGGRNTDKLPAYPIHHPRFNVDEDSLATAPALYAQFCVDYLKEGCFV